MDDNNKIYSDYTWYNSIYCKINGEIWCIWSWIGIKVTSTMIRGTGPSGNTITDWLNMCDVKKWGYFSTSKPTLNVTLHDIGYWTSNTNPIIVLPIFVCLLLLSSVPFNLFVPPVCFRGLSLTLKLFRTFRTSLSAQPIKMYGELRFINHVHDSRQNFSCEFVASVPVWFYYFCCSKKKHGKSRASRFL